MPVRGGLEMSANTTAETERETSTLAGIEADMGLNPDPTGDYAAGRYHSHASSEEFLACLASQPPSPLDG